MLTAKHVILVVSRPSCSTCRVAMAHLAKALKLHLTVAQARPKGGAPCLTTFK